MFYALFAVHIVMCVMMVLLVLLQQGKGADAGAVVRSGSDSLFGPMGSGSPVSKVTTWLAIAFMVTSIILVKVYNNSSARQSVRGVTTDVDVLSGSRVAAEEEKPAAAVAPTEVKKVEEEPKAADLKEEAVKKVEGEPVAAKPEVPLKK